MRRNGRLLAIVLAAGAVASTFGGPAAAGRDGARCAVRSGELLMADGDAVVWKRRGVYRACHKGRTYRLGADDGELGDVLKIALAGRYVAWERVACGKGSTCVGGVIVRDLERGTRREFAVPGLHRFARDLVVSRAGSVAWIRLGPSHLPNSHEVRAADAAGERVLDAGTHIDPHSLAISGRRIYWLSGGSPRTKLLSD